MGRMFFYVSLAVFVLALSFTFDSLATVSSKLGQFFRKAFSFILQKERLFSKRELAKFTGRDGRAVYIAILGCVYDVTKGKKHYGPGGSYSFFAGHDGSRAFVNGDFTAKGITDDISGISEAEVLSLAEWKDFYERDYIYVGKLVGNFYNSEGKPTEALEQYETKLKNALAEKKVEEDQRKIFPPCNSQWSQGGQTRVWCSNRSGGIERDWVGVPRQYFQPGKVQEKPRCVCIRNTGPPSDAPDSKSHNNRGDLDNPNLKLYNGCVSDADSCIKTDD